MPLLSTVTLHGATSPFDALEMVVTTPVEVILRIELLPVSATYKLPLESIAIPFGLLSRTIEPVPSTFPVKPANPAIVVTTPADVIFRIVELPLSATYTLPLASTHKPVGELNKAEAPVPSKPPEVLEPAKILVVVDPVCNV